MPIRTLIVDDSPAIQRLLKVVLEADDEIEVVGIASDPLEARTLIKQLNPDVLTLDIEMPKMNGLDFLSKIMNLRPMPVVMISSHTGKGAEMSVEALAQGAFCCLPKPRIDNEAALKEICDMVKLAGRSGASVRRNSGQATKSSAEPVAQEAAPVKRGGDAADLIVIGSSTGGVEALTTLFSTFPEDCPPTVVVQHMPGEFTRTFAKRLDGLCKPKVSEVQNRGALERGNIYIAPGSVGHTTITNTDTLRARVLPDEPIGGHIPAVDALFDSVSDELCTKVSAAILTGMGKDGAQGLLRLKNLGANTISQDEKTSLVFGMPAAAIKIGAAQQVLPITKIAAALVDG